MEQTDPDRGRGRPDRPRRVGADLDAERKRVSAVNAERVRNRGYLVFATDPSKDVDSAEYQQVYATEARTPNRAIAKSGRWLKVAGCGRS